MTQFRSTSVAFAVILIVGFVPSQDSFGQCNYGWSDEFAGEAPNPFGYLQVNAETLIYGDDGSGPSLLVGFDAVAYSGPVQKWTGNAFEGVNYPFRPLPVSPRSLAFFDDDGLGPHPAAIYAGSVYHGLWRLVDKQWEPVGPAFGVDILALVVFDDGRGPALYAAGNFANPGGLAAFNIARWDGAQWSTLGSGLTGSTSAPPVSTLVIYPSPQGPLLVAGGSFQFAGGSPARGIAGWNGTKWLPLGGGIDGPAADTQISALTVFDDGSGPMLYAGGRFLHAGGVVANNIAKWDGHAWFATGDGANDHVTALAAFNSASGPRICAAGDFSAVGGFSANHVAQWDGSNWSPMGDGLGRPNNRYDHVTSLLAWDNGHGTSLVAGGNFWAQGTFAPRTLAIWNGTQWSGIYNQALANGFGVGPPNDDFLPSPAECFGVLDTGRGSASPPSLYTGGFFNERIARWNGNGWSSVGGGMGADPNWEVRAMKAMDDDGPGPNKPALYVAGYFGHAGEVQALGVARWDEITETWSALGEGVDDLARALEVWDCGDGPCLYVGGHFTHAGGIETAHIAKWNPRLQTWSTLGSGTDAQVSTLVLFDDGSGEALYAGGRFTTAGGVPCSGIAKWNGTDWSSVGQGVGGPEPYVYCLHVHDEGHGRSALYAGGLFSTTDGQPANYIARWDGQHWNSVGGGLSGGIWTIYNGVLAMTSFDDGSGLALYAEGSFTHAGGARVNRLARWDGASWSAVGQGFANYSTFPLPVTTTHGMTAFDDGTGPALWIAGQFTNAGDVRSDNIARWQPVGPRIVAEPVGQSVRIGGDATLSLSANGNRPLKYQWRRYGRPLKNGHHISGAAQDTLHIHNARPEDAGTYDVVVSDTCGQLVSASALVEVRPANGPRTVAPSAPPVGVSGIMQLPGNADGDR